MAVTTCIVDQVFWVVPDDSLGHILSNSYISCSYSYYPKRYHEDTTFQAKMENLNLMAKKIWPPLAPNRPSSSHCECNFWPMFCSIILRCTPFATTCIVHWGLRHHSFVVHWCVVAISRLMSTSFDDFHLVQNTLWNRRIPDRVTGYFVWTRYSWK